MTGTTLQATIFSAMLLAGGAAFRAQEARSSPLPGARANEIVVKLLPTTVERPGIFHVTFDARGMPIFKEPEAVKLAHGELTIGREQVSIYLPRQGPYQITSIKDHSLENTSTGITVDANHDGIADNSELWFASRPVRLGDEMFDVKAIDAGGKWILLAKSKAPLAGAVVGKPLPAFRFKTTEGESVSLEDYKGKWLLLDIWSYT